MVLYASSHVGLTPYFGQLQRVTRDRRLLTHATFRRSFTNCQVGARRTNGEYLTILRRVTRVERQVGVFLNVKVARFRVRVQANQYSFISTRNGRISLLRQGASQLKGRVASGDLINVLVIARVTFRLKQRYRSIPMSKHRPIKVHGMGHLSMASIRRNRAQRVSINGAIGQLAHRSLYLSIRSIIGVVQAGFARVYARRCEGVGEQTGGITRHVSHLSYPYRTTSASRRSGRRDSPRRSYFLSSLSTSSEPFVPSLGLFAPLPEPFVDSKVFFPPGDDGTAEEVDDDSYIPAPGVEGMRVFLLFFRSFSTAGVSGGVEVYGGIRAFWNGTQDIYVGDPGHFWGDPQTFYHVRPRRRAVKGAIQGGGPRQTSNLNNLGRGACL